MENKKKKKRDDILACKGAEKPADTKQLAPRQRYCRLSQSLQFETRQSKLNHEA